MKRSVEAGWSPIYRVVRRIPVGRVATYGQIAALAGRPRAARQVGYALHALAAEDDVPWHRVINARGEISPRGDRAYADLQRSLLRAEGVVFDRRGGIDLDAFRWRPRAPVVSSSVRQPRVSAVCSSETRRRAAKVPAT